MDERPKNVNKFIKKYGDQKVTRLWLVRSPVQAFVQKPLDLFTGGKITKIKIEENYDNMYHLFVVFALSDGTDIHLHKMEKNAIVSIKEKEFKMLKLYKKGVDFISVPELRDYVKAHDESEDGLKTFKQIINECEKAEPCFYFYSAKHYNCQHFVDLFLKHVLPNGENFDQKSKEEYEKFILQNEFLKIFETKGLTTFTQTLTNIAASAQRALNSAHKVYDNQYDDEYDEYDDDQDEDYYYRSRQREETTRHDHHDQFASYIMDKNSYIQPVQPEYLGLSGNQNTIGSTNLFILIIMCIFALFLMCIFGCFIGISIGYFSQKIIKKIYK